MSAKKTQKKEKLLNSPRPLRGAGQVEKEEKESLKKEKKKKKSALAKEKIPMSVEKKEEENQNYLEIFCPYCDEKDFTKRGVRQKKTGITQLYKCKSCGKTFTPGSVKGKHYPIEVIIDAMSLYYLGHSLEKSAKIASDIHIKNLELKEESLKNKIKGTKGTKGAAVKDKGNIGSGTLSSRTLLNWLNHYVGLCPFSRMREFATKKYKPKDMISSVVLAHRQFYRFRHHRAKTELILSEDFKHNKFWPLKEFLDLVPVECPHQYFQEGSRASRSPITFSKEEMIVRGKHNYANKLAKFVLESVSKARDRHDALQRFLLANDTVTVATEVPIYIRREDLEHMQTQLGFKMYKKQTKEEKLANKEFVSFETNDLPKLITGHIDFLQIRNGFIHILDYKPNAAKEKPIEQLTLYALALSRLSGLRVFNFKCAWFDEKDYFEFFPLHVVYKPKKKYKKRKIITIEGSYKRNENPKRMEKIRSK